MNDYSSKGWNSIEGEIGQLMLHLTGALSKEVRWPSTACRVQGERLAVMTTNNGQFRKVVAHATIKINQGTPAEFQHLAVLEYMLFDKEEEYGLREFMLANPHKDFIFRFKFEVIIAGYDDEGNALPLLSKHGKTTGRLIGRIKAFSLEPFSQSGLIMNPTLVTKPTQRMVTSID